MQTRLTRVKFKEIFASSKFILSLLEGRDSTHPSRERAASAERAPINAAASADQSRCRLPLAAIASDPATL
jgi:hypothetical protein